MSYPPQPGGYGPYGQQQPGYGQQPGYDPQQPVTGIPASPAGGYGPPSGPPYTGTPSPPPAPGDRPGAVTTAAMLMVALTVITILVGGFAIYAGIQETGSASNPYTGNGYCTETENDDCSSYRSDRSSSSSSYEASTATAAKTVFILFGAGYLLAGLGIIALALAVLRGHNWARIVTWVVYGLAGFCGLCGFLGSVGLATDMAMGGGVVIVLASVVMLLVEAVTVILLALPVANQWFKEVGQAKRAGVI